MAQNKRAAAAAARDAEGLVRMVKGDEELDVHPTCVKAHEAVGWKVEPKDEESED